MDVVAWVSLKGCVAKVVVVSKIALYLLSLLNPPRPWTPSTPLASLPILNHPVVRVVVFALCLELPQPRRNDAGTGAHSRPYNGVSLGAGLRSRTGSDAGFIWNPGTIHGGLTRHILRSRESGNISTGCDSEGNTLEFMLSAKKGCTGGRTVFP